MNVNEVITQRIIEKLESGVAPWRNPLTQANLGHTANLVSKAPYRGINAFLTAVQGYGSPYWVTYKQALSLGGNVKKGEKGTPIVYVGKTEKTADNGETKESVFLKYYSAFNVEQCEGITVEAIERARSENEKIQACEDLIANSPMAVRIVNERSGGAFYVPALDYVNIPAMEFFRSSQDYYSTLFHELGHATGHVTRLNRESLMGMNRFGSHEYSKEELIAEMTAAFLCARTGIETATLDNSSAYIASWLKVLRNDPKFVISAAAQAQKAFDYIVG